MVADGNSILLAKMRLFAQRLLSVSLEMFDLFKALRNYACGDIAAQ